MFDAIVAAIKESVPVQTIKVGDEDFYTQHLYRLPVNDPPRVLDIHTLEGVCDYVNNHIDEVATEIFIQVAAHDDVRVYRYLDNRNTRELLVRSTYTGPGFSYGTAYQPDQFITQLMVSFENTGNREIIQKFVAGLTAESSKTFSDDGVSQTTVVKESLTGLKRADVPNPVVLKPYRTFSEIKEQPESKFVLRLEQRSDRTPTVTLHEADNAHWKVEAIGKIRDFLKGKVTIPVLG